MGAHIHVMLQVLTPHQNATLLMAAWPYKMDISGLCNALADLSARHSQVQACPCV